MIRLLVVNLHFTCMLYIFAENSVLFHKFKLGLIMQMKTIHTAHNYITIVRL